MLSTWVVIWCLFGDAPAGETVRTATLQVAPDRGERSTWRRGPQTRRAIVLIHGLNPRIVRGSLAEQIEFSSWQKPGSPMVKELASCGDVYAFSYGQNLPIDRIAQQSDLRELVEQLRQMGYSEIHLIGYSAGGLLARQLIEDHPDCGVTGVVQVCSPNAGSSWGTVSWLVTEKQSSFVRSLSEKVRQDVCIDRLKHRIPEHIAFVCVVARWHPWADGDGLIRMESQWPVDLQHQGIPAVLVTASHLAVMRASDMAQLLRQLIENPMERWSFAEVKRARRRVLGLME